MGDSDVVFNDGHTILLHECELTPLNDVVTPHVFDGKNNQVQDTTTNVIIAKLGNQKITKSLRLADRNYAIKAEPVSATITESLSDMDEKKGNSPPPVNFYVVKQEDLEPVSGTTTAKGTKTSSGSPSALCSNCGKNFFSNYNLKRHMSSCKLCPDFKKAPRYQCHCGRSYSQEWDMKTHKTNCQNMKSKCKSCLYPDCKSLFYHRSQLLSHMKKDHGVNVQDPEVLEFSSFDDFRAWKEREEEETFTYYSKQTGSNVTGVSVNTYYVCQHDGRDRTHGSSPRKTERRNKKGRVKTGRLCWSQMNVKQFRDDTVRVTYFPSHTHPITPSDTEHHPLPESIAEEIKRRLSDFKSETEGDHSTDYPEFKKSRKKSYGMSIRSLRSLARKNRKLFRITAEAMEGDDKIEEQGESTNVDSTLTDEKPSVLVLPTEDLKPALPTREEIMATCSLSWNQIKALMESGKLSDNMLNQVQATLGTVAEACQDDIMREVDDDGRHALSELTEVLYEGDAQSPDAFTVPDPQNTSKQTDRTIYQVVTLGSKDQPISSPGRVENMLYESTVELVSPREFIIIANDHAQIFQTVDRVQLGLS